MIGLSNAIECHGEVAGLDDMLDYDGVKWQGAWTWRAGGLRETHIAMKATLVVRMLTTDCVTGGILR